MCALGANLEPATLLGCIPAPGSSQLLEWFPEGFVSLYLQLSRSLPKASAGAAPLLAAQWLLQAGDALPLVLICIGFVSADFGKRFTCSGFGTIVF